MRQPSAELTRAFFPACLAVAVLIMAGNWPALAEEEITEDGVKYFETHVRPLLARHCYSCHSRRVDKPEGGLLLDARSGWLRNGDRGAAVVPGDPEASLLIRAVRYHDTDLQMPPNARLSEDSVAKLEHWIRSGAPAPDQDQVAAVDDPADPMAGRSHWAFQPLQRTEPPAVRDSDWPRSDIDRFVLARLEQDGLAPVGDADPNDLVRRLCFQLTGLPPTIAQRQAFLEHSQDKALERLVDELLASPQFGERWGRHWLDLARYADSNGLDENFLFREAWRYRNWVIAAINGDLPFDRFLQQQLAGDLLPYDSIEQRDRQRIAAGFLVIGPKVLLGVNPQQQRMDVADEQLETIGRAVLGQTLGCARCHDHKFDPVPTSDYYALAGILTSTRVMERRHMLNEQRVMEQLVGLGDGGEDADAAYETFFRDVKSLKARGEQVRSALKLLKQDDDQALADRLAKEPDLFAEVARDASQSKAARVAAQEAFLQQLVDQYSKPPSIPPRAMIPTDVAEPADEHIRVAGQFEKPGDKVPRGFLQVLTDDTADSIPPSHSGRLELTAWLTDPKGRAGGLTARVQANRIWHHLLGRGLVRTVDNFGRTGETPSHPELLDHLAVQLIDSGWSFKSVIRSIVLSRTFALGADQNAVNHAVDPENRLLWRAHRRRLDPESLRDAMLTAAGTLDLTPMESTVSYLGDQATAVGANSVRRRTDFTCRSVYLPVIRNDLPELFDVFDFANPHATTGARPATTVPTQALYMLNDAMVMDAAKHTAGRISRETTGLSAEARVERLFDLILNRLPDEQERLALLSYLQQTESRLSSAGQPEPAQQALTLTCHALFASSRFQYLE